MYEQGLTEAQARRLFFEIEDECRCHPKTFDCPVCKHETLSESRLVDTEAGKKAGRYCFGCGNTFAKITKWEAKEK